MGLFDRNDYGRDSGREYGGGRSLGNRMRGAWHRFEDRMGGHGRGYDRGFRGWGGGDRGYDAGDFAYRGTEPGWSTARNRGAHDPQWDWDVAAAGNRYDADSVPPARYGRDYRARGGYGARHVPYAADYDRELRPRDRLHTDAGDPFGDRQNRTPFRVMRGGFDREETDRGGWYEGHRPSRFARPDRYDVGYRGWNRGVGDEPAYRAEGFRGWDQDRGWR